jgi:hypothetical protein
MTLFRNSVTTHTRLDIEREHETACSSNDQNCRKEANPGKSAYGRYALRNHLRSRLRQKLGRQ